MIAPFAFDFSRVDGVGRLAACSADSPEAAARIAAAPRPRASPGGPTCAVGLGAPSPEWAGGGRERARRARPLGGGRFALRDLSAELTAPEGRGGTAGRGGAELDAALPEVFRLTTVMPPRMETPPRRRRV